MHIPDGFLDTKTIVATSIFSAIGVGRAVRNLQSQISRREVPLMGLSAAFIFVAQMINFPVAGGTSGHLLGGVLVAALLGPSAAILVMSVVLIVQCLLFADGGVLALGANTFNMAVVAPLCGFALYRLISAVVPANYGKLVGVAFASWASTVLAAVCCAGELAWSGTVVWSLGFPAMTGVHMLIGIGEGLITALVVTAILLTRPQLVGPAYAPKPIRHVRPLTDTVVYGSVLAIGFLLFITPFASPWPDGLERIAAIFGFDSHALAKPVVPSPIPDYHVPGIGSLPVATMLAGGIGAALVFLFSFVLARFLLAKSKSTPT